MKEMVRWFR